MTTTETPEWASKMARWLHDGMTTHAVPVVGVCHGCARIAAALVHANAEGVRDGLERAASAAKDFADGYEDAMRLQNERDPTHIEFHGIALENFRDIEKMIRVLKEPK